MATFWPMLSCLCFLFGFTISSHFRGGVIQWRPLDSEHFDGRIEITHRIAWRRSSNKGENCSQSTIDDRVLIGGGTLQCRVGCIGSVGSMSYYCTDFSTSEDWSAGERTYIYNASGVTYFEASYTSCCWINELVAGGRGWELKVKGNLTRRADNGLINTSPISTMPPIVRLQHGCNHTIVIPVADSNEDIIRCRWAEFSQGECNGTCRSLPNATLSECTLRYSATGHIGWYAVSLQIEDFASPIDIVPLSSVPLKFLILVFSSTLPCTRGPELVEPTRVDGSCIGVPFNTTWHEPLVAQSGAEGVSITEIITASPPGLRKSALVATGNSRQWYVNVTWPHTVSQQGPNLFCYSAIDSTELSSPQSCITLLGGVEAPQWIPNSMSPTGDIFPNQTDWSIQFDKQILRSTRSRYIKIYEENGTQVISINAATSPAVTFPQNSSGRELTFHTPKFLFTEKKRYYVLFDPGVAVGPELCGPESPPIRDPNIWVVTVGSVCEEGYTFDMDQQNCIAVLDRTVIITIAVVVGGTTLLVLILLIACCCCCYCCRKRKGNDKTKSSV